MQSFLGIPKEITSDSFIFDEERQLYTLKLGNSGNAAKIPPGKGRSIGFSFSEEIDKKLKKFYKPFDQELGNILSSNFSWMGL